MEGYSLRPATEDDLEKILEIELKVHRAPWTLEHFKTELSKPQSTVWVLTDDETDEQVAAYVVFWKLFENAEILNIAVDPALQRRGFAKAVLQAVVKDLVRQDIKKLNLEVRKSNLAAIALYQAAGLTVSQVRKNFYSDGEDAYAMSLSLEEDGIRF